VKIIKILNNNNNIFEEAKSIGDFTKVEK